MRLGTLVGRPPAEDADERTLREARIAAARRNPRFTEIPDDLVTRGHCLVSVATDEVSCRIVASSSSAAAPA